MIALVLALLQGTAAPKPPDPALLADLVARTNAVQAFVAEYRARAAGQEEPTVVRVLYGAPDRALIRFGTETTYRIHGGFLDVLGTRPGQPPIAAHVALDQPMRERLARLAAAMRTRFPAAAESWKDAGTAGVRFDLSVRETALELTASYVRPSTGLLGWLEELASAPCSPADGGRLVFDRGAGTRFTLSTATGFVEKVETGAAGGGSAFELAALDLEPALGDDAFALPPRPADALDASASFAERVQQVQTKKHRRDVLTGVARLVAAKELAWDDAAKANLAAVLEVLHADAWMLENEVWASEMRRRMDEFSAWLGERLRDPALSDAASRAKLEESVAEWRKSLPLSAAAGLEQRLSELAVDSDMTPDVKLAQDFAAIERAAVEKTLGTGLVEPLLREFEAKIAQARLGK